MFNRESQLTITESVVESADSTAELVHSITNSAADPVKIGLWVQAFKFLPAGPFLFPVGYLGKHQAVSLFLFSILIQLYLFCMNNDLHYK